MKKKIIIGVTVYKNYYDWTYVGKRKRKFLWEIWIEKQNEWFSGRWDDVANDTLGYQFWRDKRQKAKPYIGFAFLCPAFAFPWSSGTGGASFLGLCVLWLLSVPCGSFGLGRLIPAFAIAWLPPVDFIELLVVYPKTDLLLGKKTCNVLKRLLLFLMVSALKD